MRSYGEAQKKWQWEEFPLSSAMEEQHSNVFYHLKFAGDAEPFRRAIVYMPTPKSKPGFAASYFRDSKNSPMLAPSQNILESSLETRLQNYCSIPKTEFFAQIDLHRQWAKSPLDSMLRAKAMRGFELGNFLIDYREWESPLNHRQVKKENESESALKMQNPKKRAQPGGIRYISLQQKIKKIKKEKSSKPSSNDGMPQISPVEENSVVGEYKKRGERTAPLAEHYGGVFGYSSSGEEKQGIDYGDLSQSEVPSDADAKQSYSVSGGGIDVSNFIDYDSIKPKTHGSIYIALKSIYQKSLRIASQTASFFSHY